MHEDACLATLCCTYLPAAHYLKMKLTEPLAWSIAAAQHVLLVPATIIACQTQQPSQCWQQEGKGLKKEGNKSLECSMKRATAPAEAALNS